MGWKLNILIICIVCWYLYEPVPPGFSEPWKLRLAITPIRIILQGMVLAEKIGLGLQTNLLHAMLLPAPSNDSRITQDIFDGVKVRLYNVRSDSDVTRPGWVYCHGGGWVLWSAVGYDDFMLALQHDMDLVIVSVEYNLVDEEHTFPGPVNECTAAAKYFFNNADRFGVDPNRIAIGGESAGGNLAASTVLRLRDENFQPQPKLQILLYPVLQGIDFQLPSYVQYSDGPWLLRYTMAWFWSFHVSGSSKYAVAMARNQHTSPEIKQKLASTFLRHEDLDHRFQYSPYIKPKLDFGDAQMWEELREVLLDPYISPLLAEDLSGLPKAFVYTAEADVVRDEALLYVRRLKDAGNDVTHVHGDQGLHDACTLPEFSEGIHCQTNLFQFIRDNL